MKAIHKYRLGNNRTTIHLNLKQGFRVVHAEFVMTDKSVFIWIEEPLSVDIPTESVGFKLAYSGDPVMNDDTYVSTAIDIFGPEAFHIFQLAKETTNLKRLPSTLNQAA